MSDTKESVVLRLRQALSPGAVMVAVVALLALAGLGTGIAIGTWQRVCHDCPSIAQIYVWEPKQSTKVFSHDGRLIAELAEERRTPVALASLPDHVPQAFLAVEDRRFYQHEGLDYRGIARAARNLVINRRIQGGGSTITQQLARNMFTQLGHEVSWSRKLKEVRVARYLEQVYTKDEILQAYLNQINFDRGWHGIETAAQNYFGKSAPELNPAEAAMLAAIIRLPAVYTPLRHPERARSRRNLVLDLMVREGFLSPAEAARWKQEPVPEQRHREGEGQLAPYMVEWIREQLYNRYGMDLYRRGFQVYTSLDIDMQRTAEEAMRAGWGRIEASPGYRHQRYDPDAEQRSVRPNQTPYLQGMFVAMDLHTGEIRALVGGRDFRDSRFNRAVQARRQPGSTFKPFVWTAAIDAGIPASHVIYDSPIILDQVDGTEWAPRNYGGQFGGPTTLREALRRSVNIVAVKLAHEVGLESVAQYARRMGIRSTIPRYPSIAIGSAEATPLELIEAYSAFATGGERVRPMPILRVEDAVGRTIWESSTERERVLDPLTAEIMLELLRDAVDSGTGYAIRDPARGRLTYDVPAAGKTGTTNDATDVWFLGFTPDLMAGVWFGFDFPQPILPQGAAGGALAAPVWADFMRTVYVDAALLPMPARWIRSEVLTTRFVDRESGKLAGDWCPLEQTYTEIYLPGTEPTEMCDLHGPRIFGGSMRR